MKDLGKSIKNNSSLFNFETFERTKIEKIKDSYASFEDAFNDGNYTYVSVFCKKNKELQGCATILSGNVIKGLNILNKNNIQTERSLFYSAFGYWCLNQKHESIKILNKLCKKDINNKLYSKFLKILNQDKVSLISINREFEITNQSIENQFDILKVGYSDLDDLKIDFNFNNIDLEKYLDKNEIKPECVIVHRPEYVPIFNGFENLKIKKIAFITDYDLHYSQKYKDFIKFDAFITFSSVEHFELRKLFNKKTYTHILTNTIDLEVFKNIEKNQKKYDLLLTGSTFNHFFKEKSKIVALTSMLNKKYNVLINDGFLQFKEYVELMHSSKIVPSYIRYYGSFPTRSIEAIASGSNTICQENSTLKIMLDKTNIYSYKNSKDFNQKCENAIDNFEEFELSENDFQNLNKEISYERYLKFCVLKSIEIESNINKPKIVRNDFSVVGTGGHGYISRYCDYKESCENYKKIIDYNKSLKIDKNVANALGITIIYYYLHKKKIENIKDTDLIDEAIDVFKKGLIENPSSLALRFNLARILFHFKEPGKAFKVFKGVLKNHKNYKLDLEHDDLMSPLFFYGDYFQYRTYIDNVMLTKLGNKTLVNPQNIILSSVCFYLSKILYNRNKINMSIKLLKLSLKFDKNNYLTKAFLVEIYGNLKKRNNEINKKLIKYFEESVSEFPRYVHTYLKYYLQSLAESKNYEKINKVINFWFNFYKRVRENMFLLPTNSLFINEIYFYVDYMDDEAKNTFLKVNDFINQNKKVDFNIFEEEIIYTIYYNENRLEDLYKMYRIGKINFKSKIFLLKLGKYFEKIDILQSVTMYLDYLNKQEDGKIIYLSDIYNFTSRIKNSGFLEAAEKLFIALLESKHHMWGCYFHLGEIYFNKKEFSESKKYFQNCIKLNKNHQKAKLYLEKLNNC